MNTHHLRTLHTLRTQDSGYAMATALIVGIVGFAITAVITAMVLFTVRGSQRGSETVADRAVAEAGIDSARAAIEQSTGNAVPCSINGSLSSGQQASYTVTIAYYAATSTLLTCTPGAGVTATPATAVITSVGTTAAAGQAGSTASRTMEARVTLAGGGGGGGGGTGDSIPWAIVSGGDFTVADKWNVTGTSPPVSLAGNLTCSEESSFQGNFNVQGNVTLTDDCKFGADLWAGGRIYVNDNDADVVVNGNLKAVGDLDVRRGDLTVNGNLIVSNISRGSASVVGSRIFSPPNPSVGAPPIATYPQLDYNATTWTGWNPVTPASGSSFPCSRTLPSLTGKTVYLAYTGAPGAGCSTVNWTGNTTLNLTHDVTIFADRFTIGDTLTVRSSNGSKLRLIVPALGASTCPSTPTNRTITGTFNIEDSASVLLYARARVAIDGDSDIRGQIVTCQLTGPGGNHDLNLEYVMVGAPGAGGISPPSPSGNYTVTEEYRRDA